MHIPTRRTFLALAAAAVLAPAGCNRELQGHADVFLDALATDDYAKFEAIAGDELRREVDTGMFSDLTTRYSMLGTLEDKTRTGVGWHDGNKNVDYSLEFASGDVTLQVVSTSDKLDGFKLGGLAWREAGVKLHRGALEQFLQASAEGDVAAARPLMHASIQDDELGGLMTQLKSRGPVREIVVADAELPEFRVAYGDGASIFTTSMRGRQLVGVKFRPADEK